MQNIQNIHKQNIHKNHKYLKCAKYAIFEIMKNKAIKQIQICSSKFLWLWSCQICKNAKSAQYAKLAKFVKQYTQNIQKTQNMQN